MRRQHISSSLAGHVPVSSFLSRAPSLLVTTILQTIPCWYLLKIQFLLKTGIVLIYSTVHNVATATSILCIHAFCIVLTASKYGLIRHLEIRYHWVLFLVLILSLGLNRLLTFTYMSHKLTLTFCMFPYSYPVTYSHLQLYKFSDTKLITFIQQYI